MSFNKALQQKVSGFEADVTIRYLLIYHLHLYVTHIGKYVRNHLKSQWHDQSSRLSQLIWFRL